MGSASTFHRVVVGSIPIKCKSGQEQNSCDFQERKGPHPFSFQEIISSLPSPSSFPVADGPVLALVAIPTLSFGKGLEEHQWPGLYGPGKDPHL